MSGAHNGSRARAGGAPPPASAAAGTLPERADALASILTSPHAGGGAEQLAAAASRPGAAVHPPSPAPAATPGAADAPVAGLAALLVHTPGPGEGAAAGEGAPATGQAPPASPSLGAWGGAASASTDAGPAEVLDDDGVPLSAEAAASPFSPPATQRHAAILKLVDHQIKAGLQCRYMRAADFSALAAVAGAPLFGDKSIIVAYLRATEARELSNQAYEEVKRGSASLADAALLYRRAWVVLLAQALPVLQSRMDKGTLLPGKLRRVEEAYYAYEQQMIRSVKDQPVPSAASLLTSAATFGYETATLAVVTALIILPLYPWRADQRERAQNFVVAVLRLIPHTALVTHKMGHEIQLVDCIERHVTPANHGADFCASVLAVWRSRSVVDVLRSRGSLQGGAAASAAYAADFAARQQADLARKGLRRCGLPSCGKLETTVLQFRVCGHCQTTRYCCPEHAKLHWRAHKREYDVEEEGDASGGGGGFGGA